ncbi:MAG TPA: V-type ATP synthase subunit E family protein [Nitrososphaeraceae archaeon]
MSNSSALNRTIDKVLSQREAELISKIDSSYQEALSNLEASRSNLQSEYNRILETSRKQAENLKRQILGSKRLSARNKELVLIEEAVNTYFEKAKERLGVLRKDKDYRHLINEILEECISAMDSNEIVIECNEKDLGVVSEEIKNVSKKNAKVKLSLSNTSINVIGGIRAKSGDGSMTYDNTVDSRIERLKPLIRKDIVQMLRGE